MTAVIFTVALIELIAYAVFLQRLANTVRRDKPAISSIKATVKITAVI